VKKLRTPALDGRFLARKELSRYFFFKCILKNIDDYETYNISQYASEKKTGPK
jgi:hypothetical protein